MQPSQEIQEEFEQLSALLITGEASDDEKRRCEVILTEFPQLKTDFEELLDANELFQAELPAALNRGGAEEMPEYLKESLRQRVKEGLLGNEDKREGARINYYEWITEQVEKFHLQPALLASMVSCGLILMGVNHFAQMPPSIEVMVIQQTGPLRGGTDSEVEPPSDAENLEIPSTRSLTVSTQQLVEKHQMRSWYRKQIQKRKPFVVMDTDRQVMSLIYPVAAQWKVYLNDPLKSTPKEQASRLEKLYRSALKRMRAGRSKEAPAQEAPLAE